MMKAWSGIQTCLAALMIRSGATLGRENAFKTPGGRAHPDMRRVSDPGSARNRGERDAGHLQTKLPAAFGSPEPL